MVEESNAVEENGSDATNSGTNKLIDVVGAAIVRNGKVLCARRGSGKSLSGYWGISGRQSQAGGESP